MAILFTGAIESFAQQSVDDGVKKDKRARIRNSTSIRKEARAKNIQATEEKKVTGNESREGGTTDTKMKTVRKPVKKTASRGK